jgi:hypothetical protein
LGSKSINKFSVVELCVAIQITSADYRHEQVVIWQIGTLDEEALQVDAVNPVALRLVNLVE